MRNENVGGKFLPPTQYQFYFGRFRKGVKNIMAKKDSTEVSIVPDMPTKLVPAATVGMNTNLPLDPKLIPSEFQGVDLEVIQTGFNPSVVWNEPGNFCAGVYTGFEEKIGPNNANLYNFETKQGKPFSVWGTTILDRSMEKAIATGTIKPGYLVMLTFVGTIPSKFADNPTKLFHIAVAKK